MIFHFLFPIMIEGQFKITYITTWCNRRMRGTCVAFTPVLGPRSQGRVASPAVLGGSGVASSRRGVGVAGGAGWGWGRLCRVYPGPIPRPAPASPTLNTGYTRPNLAAPSPDGPLTEPKYCLRIIVDGPSR